MLLRDRMFTDAIGKLKQAVEKDNNFIEAHLRLAFSYELLRNIDAQQYHLEQVVRIAPKSQKYKNVYYSLGKVYFNRGQYEKAREMTDILDTLGVASNSRIKPGVELLKENIAFAIENIRHPLEIDPKPMPDIINSFQLQYFPVLTADEKTIIYTARNGTTYRDDENIVISIKDDNGNWQAPFSISSKINSEFNEGTCSISADGRILIFTSCEGRKTVGGCDLYITYKSGDEWTIPQNLGRSVNSRSWDSQPALSADGRTLYFISDRGGGYGKRDIWMSRKDANGNWTPAINLGPAINTREDEVSPFIHVNGTTLFFASKGYPGFGGFDLYKSELVNSAWTKPENLGYPINTAEDQVSLFVSTNGKNGYYSYEVKGDGRNDRSLLYTFSFPEDIEISNKTIYLTGFVYDFETKKPLEAKIEVYNLASEEDTPLTIFSSDPVTGKYFSILPENKRIALYVEREGYLFESRSFEVEENNSNSIRQDFYLKTMKAGNTVRLNNIFFEFDSDRLTDESKTELNKVVRFLNSNPDIKITISGHTDDVGSTEYNQRLSEKRAKAVYDFLINHGIEPEKLTYKGYGESKPLVSNTDEKSRQMNRRIEFSIDR